jgi:hypothetical protein
MSDSPASGILSLVNERSPINAPRKIHVQLGTVTLASAPTVISRVLHSTVALQDLLELTSDAYWEHASIEFVPRAALKHCHLAITVALHGSSGMPSDLGALNAHGSCSYLSSGGSGEMPSLLTYRFAFNDHFISPLIKPTPLFKPLSAFSFHTTVTYLGEESLPAATTAILDVYIRGSIVLGGAA